MNDETHAATGLDAPVPHRTTGRRPLDVVVVGAGPYGLSVAAHVRAAGLGTRIFGMPMAAWTRQMPAGMLLKSEPAASHLSDPAGNCGYDAYCRINDLPYSYGDPIPVERFAAYGRWFGEQAVGEVEQRLVSHISPSPKGFRVTIDDGEVLHARSVVMATGTAPFAYSPAWFGKLPSALAGHAAQYPDLRVFRGRRVAVIGAGQSALETAVLLAERGARPHLLAAGPRLEWNDPPLTADRSLLRRLRSPQTALGSGLRSWVLANAPGAVRHLPLSRRLRLVRTTLGPAGAWWLKERFTDVVPLSLNVIVVDARVSDEGMASLRLHGAGGELSTMQFDHVIAATGYRVRLDRIRTLDPVLSRRLADRWVTGVVAGPVLNRSFESAVPDLYFTGLPTAPTFGPVMRFVAGTRYSARAISRAISVVRT